MDNFFRTAHQISNKGNRKKKSTRKNKTNKKQGLKNNETDRL